VSVWSPYLKTDIDLEIVPTQSKHCKLVKGLEHEHKSYEKRLNFLCYHIVGVWRREELRCDLIQVYWIMHGLWWYRQIKL